MIESSRFRARVRLALGLAVALASASAAYSVLAKPEPRVGAAAQAGEPAETPSSKARARKLPPKLTDQMAAAEAGQAAVSEPVRHAREAKLGRCIETITRASNGTIDSTHAAISTWSPKGPDDHMFQSVVALSYSNAVAPKAAAVLVAAPEGVSCEATTVQVYPTARSCGTIENDLKRAGRTVADFGGVPMTQERTAARQLLLPAPGAGCVVVSVGLALNP